MPTASFGPTASTHDGYEDTYWPSYTDNGVLVYGFYSDGKGGDGYQHTGIVLPAVTIPQAATITVATLYMYQHATWPWALDLTIDGYAADDFAGFGGGIRPGTAWSPTTASASWTNPTTGSDGDLHSKVITSIIQELVNRSGWVSGNDMGIAIHPTIGQFLSGQYLKSWDIPVDHSLAPYVTIEWTEGSPPAAPLFYRRR